MSSDATQTVTVYDVLAWLETNKKTLIIGFVAVVLIGFGIAVYRYNADQKELAASDALLKLKTTLGGNDTTPQPEPSAYLKVAAQYPGTGAAERALLLAASAMFTEGKYPEAQAEFTKFLRDHPQSPFAATAAYGIAAALEAQGKRDEALTAYQNLSVRYPNSSVLEDAKLATARLYEAKNQPEQALRLYDEIVKSAAMGAASSQAMTRKQDLLARHPELAVTNALPASATAVAIPAVTNVVASLTNPLMSTAKTNAATSKSTNLAPAKP